MSSRLAYHVADFLKREDGPTAVEYAVMLALIIVAMVAAITTLGQNANGTFSNVALNDVFTASNASGNSQGDPHGNGNGNGKGP